MAGFGERNRWGDDEEDDDVLPDPTETAVDERGMKTRIEYKFNDHEQKVKVKKTIKVITTTARVPKRVEERRARLVKFGRACDVKDESNITITDYNEVMMLHPKEAEAEDDGQAANMSKAFESFVKKQQERALHNLYDGDAGGSAPPKEDDAAGGMGGGSGSGGKYVPPSLRKAGAGPVGSSMMGSSLSQMAVDDRDLKTLRVTNISEDTKEADLQQLFEPFGNIYRIYLAKDKETNQSRGFAFISFSRREDAERAMTALQGYGYDHLILKLEWAKPAARDPNAPATQFRSGYGKALAQDTDQKVSYASNLTH